MANATKHLVGRSGGHEWAVFMATSGHFCWPSMGTNYWPLTRPGPENTGAPTKETIRQVLDLPGCRGLYYLFAADNKSLSISLWDDEKVLADSRQAVDRIRSETSAEQHLQILEVQEFEVLTSEFKGYYHRLSSESDRRRHVRLIRVARHAVVCVGTMNA